MRNKDRFKYIYHPRPPGWREKLARGEGLLFWLLATLGSALFLYGLVFLLTY